MFLLLAFAALFLGAIALILVEYFFTERSGPDSYGSIHGNTSGRPRVIGYIVVGIIGFIAMIIELITLYGR